MTFNNGKNSRAFRDARQRYTDHPPTKLCEIIPNDLAYNTIEAVLWYLDRLAIHLFPRERTAELTELSERDHRTRTISSFQSSLGRAVAGLATYAQSGTESERPFADDIEHVWGAAYTRPIDRTWTPAIDTLGHTHPLDIVMRAALARHRIAAGEPVSVFDLVALSGGDESVLRRELIPPGAGTVDADAARSWLRMLAVEGFDK